MVSILWFLVIDLFLCAATFDQIVWEHQSSEVRTFAHFAPALFFLAVLFGQLLTGRGNLTSSGAKRFFGNAVLVFASAMLCSLALIDAALWWLIGFSTLMGLVLRWSRLSIAVPAPRVALTWLIPALLLYAFNSQQSLRAHEALQGVSIPTMHIGIWAGIGAEFLLLYRVLRGRRHKGLEQFAFVLPTALVTFWIVWVASADGFGMYGEMPSNHYGIIIALCFWSFVVRLFLPKSEVENKFERGEVRLMGGIALGAVLHVIYCGYALWRSIPTEAIERVEPSKHYLRYLLTAEDPLFFVHGGVDYFRINGALRGYFDEPLNSRGGSTISMQLVKVLTDNRSRTVSRKYTQIVSALILERLWSKDEILQCYVSVIPYAPGVFGIKAAAKYFFDTVPERLGDQQSLQLVLSIYDPESYNPSLSAMPPEVLRRQIVIKARAKRFADRLHLR